MAAAAGRAGEKTTTFSPFRLLIAARFPSRVRRTALKISILINTIDTTFILEA
jgi:hypothetical protein